MKTSVISKYVCSIWAAAVLCALPLSARAQYSNAVLGLNPIAYYQFDETTGVPGANITNLGTAGLAGTGNMQNNPDLQVQGALIGSADTAMHFNSSIFAYVGVPYSAAINPSATYPYAPNPLAPFTIEAWLNADTAYAIGSGTLGAALSFGQFNSPREGWVIYQSETGWNLRMYNNIGADTAVNITGGGVLTPNTWYHVAAVYDGTNATLYVNGTNAAQSSAAGFFPTTTARILSLALRTDFSFPWSGSMDEFAIYTNALAAADVMADYQNGTSASPSPSYETLVQNRNPLLYYRLDDAVLTGTQPTSPNIGSLGSAADATYGPGSVSGLPGVPFAGFGLNNHAVQFNGLSAYVQVPPLMGVVTDQFTFTCWLRYNLNPGGGGQPVMWQRNGSDNTTDAMGLMTWDSSQFFTMWNDQDYGVLPVPPAIVPTFGWTFLAAVWTPTNTTIYVNGTPYPISDPSHATRDFSVGPINFGNDINNNYTIDGVLDEVAMFNYALSPAQLQSLYIASEATPQIESLVKTPADPVYEGETVNITVSAAGPGTLGYQWRTNGLPITGQTSNSIILTNVAVANSSSYQVVITNAYGSVTSAIVALDVVAGPPQIFQGPQPGVRFIGASDTFSVTTGGTQPISYLWSFNGSPISGATGSSYTVSNISAASVGSYTVQLTNSHGTNNTTPVALTAVPVTCSYAAAIIAAGVNNYWRFNEASGSIAYDYAGGNNATNFGGVTNAVAGATFPGLESNNVSDLFDGTDSYVAGNPLNYNTNVGTIIALVNPNPAEPAEVSGAQIAICRGSLPNDCFSLGLAGDGLSMVYVFDNDAGTYTFNPSYVPASGQWNFTAISVDTNQAVMYIDDGDGSGLNAATNMFTTTTIPMAGDVTIGTDPYFFPGRVWNGGIDEVAFFNRPVTFEEMSTLHYVLYHGTIKLAFSLSGSTLTLRWPAGSLQSAAALNGPWTPVAGATSPYAVTTTGTQMFYKVGL